MQRTLTIIGRASLLTIGETHDIPAKVDTGADYSSIWASSIKQENGALECVLFAPSSRFYTGEVLLFAPDEYEMVNISSSTGHWQKRYVVMLPITIEDETHEVRFSLADRATMTYPVLLGRHFLSGLYLVDTSIDIPAEFHRQLVADNAQRSKALAQTKE